MSIHITQKEKQHHLLPKLQTAHYRSKAAVASATEHHIADKKRYNKHSCNMPKQNSCSSSRSDSGSSGFYSYCSSISNDASTCHRHRFHNCARTALTYGSSYCTKYVAPKKLYNYIPKTMPRPPPGSRVTPRDGDPYKQPLRFGRSLQHLHERIQRCQHECCDSNCNKYMANTIKDCDGFYINDLSTLRLRHHRRTKMLRFKCNDRKIILIEAPLITKFSNYLRCVQSYRKFKYSKAMILPTINSYTLLKILVWLQYHRDDDIDELTQHQPYYAYVSKDNNNNNSNAPSLTSLPTRTSLWDADYLNMKLESLAKLIMGLNFLNIEPLMTHACCFLNEIMWRKSSNELNYLTTIKEQLKKLSYKGEEELPPLDYAALYRKRRRCIARLRQERKLVKPINAANG